MIPTHLGILWVAGLCTGWILQQLLPEQSIAMSPVVTASVDNISFTNPIKLGNVVHIEAKISRAFNTSMEVHLNVWGEDIIQQYRYKSNEAFFTFVALDPMASQE